MKKGFTLIELLLVISIIALLSSIFISSTKTAKVKAAEAIAEADMRQLNTALELYRSSNDRYPVVSGTISSSGLEEELVPEYISGLPVIPKLISNQASGSAGDEDYYVSSNGDVAISGPYYLRCGPGNRPDPIAIWYRKSVTNGPAVPSSRRLYLSASPDGPYSTIVSGGCYASSGGGGEVCTFNYLYCVPQY